uniref:Rab3 GTPase-activating protein catalytic subunit n=1 Tax=Spongospora subterranea TaxID=70186 RepID=A0A0H5RCQ5_9EUKA|eukprot:CRZ06279.1 hypothetical protein [Spongospora subterranea]
MLPPNAPCGGIHLDTNTCWGSTSSHRLLFHLDVHWTPFPEGTFVSDSIFSDLIPISAPIWRLFCRLDPGLTVSLSSRLRQFLSICRKCSSFESVQAIALLDHSFTPLYILDDQVHDIFSTDALGSYAMASTSSIKSCPFLSILSKLVLVMAQQPDDEPHRIAQLYNAFVNELQRHWDHALPLKLPISDPSEAIPDLSTCILYQKIQVLAHCISLRTVAIENRASATISPSAQRASDWVDFDGYSGVENLEECSSIIGDSRGSADVAAVPEGINHDIFLSDMFLLEGGQQMHVPLTLESPLMTEDEVDAQHALMAGLGTDHESSSIRAEMQSASLLSDMSAFKAANPACVLEDFIRWYSPNDWVEGKGLSRRMSGVNNLWRKCWSKAVACPASRQKPLFDYIAQGERILDYFRTINPAALMQQIESVAIGNAAHVIGSAFMILGDMPRTRRTVAQLFTAESNSNVVAHIEKVERMACLMQRLPSNMIRLPLIDDILHDNVAMIMADTDRQLLLDGMDEKFRNLSLPDQRRYTVVNDIEESVVVEIEGGTPAVFGDQGGIDPDRIAIATASSI